MAGPHDARLRILLTVHHELSTGQGAAGSTLALADELERRGHRVEVAGLGLLSRSRGGLRDAVAFPHVVARVARVRLERDDLDVLDASSGDLAYLRRAHVAAARCAVVTRSHGLEHLAIERRRQGASDGELRLRRRYSLYHAGLRRWEVTRSLRTADGILVLNEAEARFASSSLGISAGRIWRTAPVVEPVVARRDEVVRDVLVLGPASWRKGGDVALRVLETLLRGEPSMTASWHGLDDPGSTAAALSADVRARTVLAGRYPRAALASLLGSHRVLLFASRSEGLPVTLLEAMSARLAVVGTDVPGVRDLLGAGAGVLVPDGHVAGLVAAVRGLLADDDARVACATVGERTAARFAPATVVDDLVASYRAVLDLKR